ncbi:MAG: hypothetical protein ACTSYA_02300 [Candidatus Kariarchaeaceae archaeon]
MKLLNSLTKGVFKVLFVSMVCSIVFGALIVSDIRNTENIVLSPIDDDINSSYREYLIYGGETNHLQLVIASYTIDEDWHHDSYESEEEHMCSGELMTVALVDRAAYDSWNRSLSPVNYSSVEIFSEGRIRLYETDTSKVMRSFETSNEWTLIIWNLGTERSEVFVGIAKIKPVFIILFAVSIVIFSVMISLISMLVPVLLVVGVISLLTKNERRHKKEYYDYLERQNAKTSTVTAESQVNDGKSPLEAGKTAPKRVSATPWRASRRMKKMNKKQEIFEEMNFAERLIGGIAIAFVTLGIVFGITISWIVFGPLAFVAVILLALSFSIYFQRKKLENDLISIVKIHGQLSLADTCRLLGHKPEKIISAYLDLQFSSDEIVFEPSSSMFITK